MPRPKEGAPSIPPKETNSRSGSVAAMTAPEYRPDADVMLLMAGEAETTVKESIEEAKRLEAEEMERNRTRMDAPAKYE